METVVTIECLKDIANIFWDLPIKINPKKIKIRYYGYDDRIKWETYIVTYQKYGVLGFTNGELKYE